VNNNQGMSNAKLLDYLVDNEGYIDYPGLGKLKVNGLTTRECEALMRDELQKYLNEVPNVTVRVSNFKVSVLGEVNKPGTFLVTDEQINVFQALALAGDMTLFSRRQDVQLMRADANGKVNTIHLDLTDANITASPYFYLQQNDILYVKPTKMKVYSNTFNNNSSMWLGLLSTIASFISLFIIVYY
jgi:polysaccharide export outer membrane protein